jgi:TP901 family phage tail tape measure protein
MADLKLQVIMALADKAAGPLKNITKGSKEAAQALRAARDTVKDLNAQQGKIDGFAKQQAAMAAASQRVKLLQQNIDALRTAHGAHSTEVVKAEKALAKATTEFDKQRQSALQLRTELSRAGVGNVAQAQANVAAKTKAANEQITRQVDHLKRLGQQQKRVAQLNDLSSKAAKFGAGAGAVGAGAAVGANSVVDAYAQQETAQARFTSSMMLANGQAAQGFREINALATKLGDKLPGTTADFIEMMTMLRRQGLSANTILGGTGEATAYLGVLLKKAPSDAAEFAAKLQDATRTVDKDMMGLMDTIQRTFYLGVDDNNMLQAFSKLSPALSVLKKEGVNAANALAPLVVLADQAGMRGEASGNAIRKVLQMSMNRDKVSKASLLAGVNLDFTNGKGEFGGMEKMFAELSKMRGINTAQRLAALKEAFGDDGETLQVLTLMIERGQGGYDEVLKKMQAQASLQQRVSSELTTIANLKEAAGGTITNVLAAFGETIAPDIKKTIEFLADIAAKTRDWTSENKELSGWIAKTTLVVTALLIGLGASALVFAGLAKAVAVLSPFFLVLGGAIKLVGSILAIVGRALLLNPIGLAIAGIAAAAYLIYRNWSTISTFFSGVWASISNGVMGLWNTFRTLGGQLMDGLIGGIMSRLNSVRQAIGGVADGVIGFFREKLGIKSPSRVFMQAGSFLGEGAALGIERSNAMVRRAAVGMTAAAMVPLAGAAAIDGRAPLSAGAARAGTVMMQGDTITIQVVAASGQDPQSLAKTIALELEKRAAAKQARARGALTDF